MQTYLLQTYKEDNNWKDGDELVKTAVVDKEEAHIKYLLHQSVHLLIIDDQKRILSRERKASDNRYPALWTSSTGTHVLQGDDYFSTLRNLLPIQKDMKFIGEFRVKDRLENEVNGLYLMKANKEDLPMTFLEDKKFFTIGELQALIADQKVTPHLKGGFELLEQKQLLN